MAVHDPAGEVNDAYGLSIVTHGVVAAYQLTHHKPLKGPGRMYELADVPCPIFYSESVKTKKHTVDC